MSTEQAYWDSVQECRGMVEELIVHTEQWIARMPEVQRLLTLQERAVARLSHVHPEIPGVERRRQRANLLHAGRSARFRKIWEEKGVFAQEAQTKFGELSAVLITDEVERRKARVNWADPVSILNALRAQRKGWMNFGRAAPERAQPRHPGRKRSPRTRTTQHQRPKRAGNPARPMKMIWPR